MTFKKEELNMTDLVSTLPISREEASNVTDLISTLRLSLHRIFLVVLVGFALTSWPAFTSTAFGAQELKSKNLDEEKRLFYVAITRAKKRLYITCNTAGYYGSNEKSTLINFIPSQYIVLA